MYLTKSQLLNDVRDVNAELLYEGVQDVDDRNDEIADLEQPIAKKMVHRKDYNSQDDYEDAVDDFFYDGENELCFVKRDSVLCTALMNFYCPKGGSVKDFEKVAKKNIIGFRSQMLVDGTTYEGYSNEEGFWFVAGSDYLDALVPYNKQKAFMKSVNPSLTVQIHNNVSEYNLGILEDAIDRGETSVENDDRSPVSARKATLKVISKVRNALGL